MGDKRGLLLTARGSQPMSSHTPMAEKQICHGDLWGGITEMNYLLRRVVHCKIFSSSEHSPQEALLTAVFFKFNSENAIQ